MRRLKSQYVDFSRISLYLSAADNKLSTAKKMLAIDEEASYQMAYEAMLKASLGFMLSFGVRPRSLPGHHMTIIEFAEKYLGTEFKSLITMFNRMRRKRHQAIYEVTGFVSATEAERALVTAERYLSAIRHEIRKKNPQLQLL